MCGIEYIIHILECIYIYTHVIIIDYIYNIYIYIYNICKYMLVKDVLQVCSIFRSLTTVY